MIEAGLPQRADAAIPKAPTLSAVPEAAAGTARLPPLHALRGLIMVLMALAPPRAFVPREHPFEFWGAPLPHSDHALPFITRLVTHFCAPGFFFLMGIGMTLLADSRRRMGWSGTRIAGYFVRRGIVLLLVEQLIENPAWLIGSLGAAPSLGSNPSASTPMLVFGVLCALAMVMTLWSPFPASPSILVGALSAATIIVPQLAIPPQSAGEVAFSPVWRMLLIPGQTGIWFVLYPIVPWIGMTGLGI